MTVQEQLENSKSKEFKRKKFEDLKAMEAYKEEWFDGKQTSVDEYTGETVHRKKGSTERKYHSNANLHLANTDHIVSLKAGYDETKYNHFVTDEQVREALNQGYNYAITNARINQSKREKVNREFALQNNELSDEAKERMIQKGKEAHNAFKRDIRKASFQNAGDIALSGAVQRGKYTAISSTLNNTDKFLQGDKEFCDVITDTICVTLKSGVNGACSDVLQVMGRGAKDKITDGIRSSKIADSISNVPGISRLSDLPQNSEMINKLKQIFKNKNAKLLMNIGMDVGKLTTNLLTGDITSEEYRDKMLETGVSTAVFNQVALLTAPYGLVASVVMNFITNKVMNSIKKYFETDNERQIRIQNYIFIGSQAEAEGQYIEKILHSARDKYTSEISAAMKYIAEARKAGDENLYGKGLTCLCDCYGMDLPVNSNEDMLKLLKSDIGHLTLGSKVEISY